ncbi:hypothetical protein GIB67_042854 [Kingdonia uniflora]|uniref:Aminotransferase-like plant mobile domain-containing protein n=1 Tax=Kingdonia uniflora TaxID=39325 RepID=A0A7J7NSB3_9MAGN|nr:hypothetical protein GIB67_042854 [Kingdonia uniflora]
MQMAEGEPHPSTLPGFRGRRDPERSVTRSRSRRKKKRVEFEDVQPQDIPNPTEDNFPRRCITQLPDEVGHIYYTGKELTVPYDGAWSILSNARQLLPNIDSSHIKSGNVSIAHLKTYLTIEIHREDDITIARAFILFIMGHLWFQTANNTVPLGYLATVNDLDLAAQYDWGSTILASLYHGLDTAVTTGGAITRFVQLLPYWFYEYCGVGHPIVKEEVTGEVRIPLDPPLSMSPHISPATLHEMRQAGFVDCEQFVVGEVRETYASYWAEQISEIGHMLTDSQRMGNLDLFGPSALRAGITPVVVMSASVHSLSQDFSLPNEAEGPDQGWHMQWTGQCENLPIAHLRDPPPMSSSYGTEELWHLTHGMRRLIFADSARDAQRIQEVEEELVIARRKIDSIDHQLYAHDLQLRRGRNVGVVPLPPGVGAKMRQRGSGLRTRGGSTSRRGRGTGDDSE